MVESGDDCERNQSESERIERAQAERLAGAKASIEGRSRGAGSASEGWRGRSSREAKELLKWAQSVGLDQGELLPTGPQDGSEHRLVFNEKSQRWSKQTHPGIGYGLYPIVTEDLDFETQQWVSYWDLREGTPFEYLERFQISREIFGDTVALEAILPSPEGPVVQISQAHLVGCRASGSEIRDFMRGQGFREVDEGWWRAADGTFAGDTHRGNFVKTPDGLLPIDVVLARPKGDIRNYFEARTSG